MKVCVDINVELGARMRKLLELAGISEEEFLARLVRGLAERELARMLESVSGEGGEEKGAGVKEVRVKRLSVTDVLEYMSTGREIAGEVDPRALGNVPTLIEQGFRLYSTVPKCVDGGYCFPILFNINTKEWAVVYLSPHGALRVVALGSYGDVVSYLSRLGEGNIKSINPKGGRKLLKWRDEIIRAIKKGNEKVLASGFKVSEFREPNPVKVRLERQLKKEVLE